jgi:hypothetical protein
VVIDRLESRAAYGDLGSRLHDSAYHALYDFLVTWGNYKHAAAAMLAYARRVRVEVAAEANYAAGSRQDTDAAVAEVQAAYGALGCWPGAHCAWQLLCSGGHAGMVPCSAVL